MPSQGVSEIFLQGKQNAAVGSDTEALGGRGGESLYYLVPVMRESRSNMLTRSSLLSERLETCLACLPPGVGHSRGTKGQASSVDGNKSKKEL